MPTPIPTQIYYCRIRNCQRTCGLVHRDASRKRYTYANKSLSMDRATSMKATSLTQKSSSAPDRKKQSKRKARAQRSIDTNSSTSVSNGSSGRESQNHVVKEPKSTQHLSTFEEIMERAARKVSDIKLEDAFPVPTPRLKSMAEKRAMLAPSVSLDTTTIHFDQPVWDNPELREELLDSEEDFALDATPPPLKEDSLAVDDIISEATHAVDYNPIDHDRQDEMISGWSSDDNDYSELDLTQVRRQDSPDSVVIPIRRRAFRGAYEQSIDVADSA
ncbi:hypothetical protein Q1695_013148 [Nippostrongylus brasiliensis]|nr:hypothetical protein Q1695_013148 [Nippostrongylus brasiliensis]